jgi:hypothetical protein
MIFLKMLGGGLEPPILYVVEFEIHLPICTSYALPMEMRHIYSTVSTHRLDTALNATDGFPIAIEFGLQGMAVVGWMRTTE